MSYVNLLYHIVFSTKGRRPWLTADHAVRLQAYLGGIVRNAGGQALAVGGMTDHVHIAALAPATVSLADLLRDVKARSSGWVHQTFAGMAAFGWQDGYAAFSVSASVMPKVVAYVGRQEEHHRKMTFQEELVALLDRHGVEYDERYVWK